MSGRMGNPSNLQAFLNCGELHSPISLEMNAANKNALCRVSYKSVCEAKVLN